MISRRKMVLALGASALASAFLAGAQPAGGVSRIGFFYLGSRQSALDTRRYSAFLQGMQELGYVEGKHFVIEARFADGKSERLPSLAAELLDSKVDVIVATGTPVYDALKRSTGSVPIVITVTPDPVRDGYAKSLSRPGGNFTGLSNAIIDLSPKQLELLKTALPKLSRIAVLSNPANLAHPPQVRSLKAAAQQLGISVVEASGGTPDEIERAFAAMTRDRAEAMIALPDTFFLQQARQIAGLALKHRLPSIHGVPDFAVSGGFMSFGPNFTDNFRLAAGYVDKILKGAKPGELPFGQPTRFYLVINRKTAKTLGLTISQELLLRADEVIE
jgi:putative ABC transport system substrate-binding protein